MKKIQHILVPIDGSEHSINAIEQAISLAENQSIKLSFLYVTNIQKISVDSYLLDEILKSHHHMGENILKNAKEKVPSGIDAKTYLEEGTPSTTIVNFAKRNNVDLIIMGTRGLGSVQSALLGSVSHDVIHHATCSVMLCK